MEEIWKDIAGYEGLYQVSNLGRVKSLPKIKGSGKGYLTKELIMVPKLDRYGYHILGLRKENKKTFFSIHRLVANAFLINKDNKATVDHINKNKLDNTINNLRWATYVEQCQNRNVKGIINGSSKLTEKEVLEIRNSNLSTKLLAEEFKVSKSTIERIKNKTLWKHI